MSYVGGKRAITELLTGFLAYRLGDFDGSALLPPGDVRRHRPSRVVGREKTPSCSRRRRVATPTREHAHGPGIFWLNRYRRAQLRSNSTSLSTFCVVSGHRGRADPPIVVGRYLTPSGRGL